MTRRAFAFVTAIATTMLLCTGAFARLVGIGKPSVRFLAVGPAGLKIDGHSSLLSAEENKSVIEVTTPLTHLYTGISLRDHHLRGYLETDKYPSATLAVSRSALKLPQDRQTIEAQATGRFTLHGVSRSVPFRYKALRTGSDYHVQGLMQIDIRDYKVEVPCFLGVCVHPVVKIKVKFKLREIG